MKNLKLVCLLLGCCLFFTGCTNPLDKNKRSGIQIMTNDVPASIFLDGQYLDKTPYINKTIKEGEYKIRLEPDDKNLSAYETPINLHKGLLTVITWKPGDSPETSGGVIYELEPINNRNKAQVSFISIPDNTIIQFDDQEKQFAPLILEDLEPGHHEFEATLPSFETQKHTVNLIAGHRLNITVKLAKMSNSADASSSATPTQSANNATTAANQTAPDATSSTAASSSTQINKTDFLANAASKSASTVTGPRVKIKKTNFFQDGAEVLRVRDQASSAGKEIGFVVVGNEYRYLGETKNGWHQIEFADNTGKMITGWINNNYGELIST